MASVPTSAWKLESSDQEPAPDSRAQSTSLLVFACAFLLPLELSVAGFPTNTLAALGLTLIGLSHAADAGRKAPGWYGPLLASVPLWLIASGVMNGVFDVRRTGTALAWAGLAFVVGTGRLHVPSVARGAVWGLAFGLISVYVGLAPSEGYGGRLTGWISDPNGVAMTVLSIGLASAPWVSTRRRRTFLVLGLVLVMVFLTESRTGWLALGLALVWVLYLRKLNIVGAAAVAWAVVYLFENLPDSIKYWGPFAERAGSDELRERILVLERELVAHSPWVGNGPGTAHVFLDDQFFFFHSSYYGARAEGGYILLALLCLTGLLLFVFVAKAEKTWRTGLVQGAIIGQAITAMNIGESLLTPACSAMIGLAMWWALSRRPGEGAVLGDTPRLSPAQTHAA